MVYYILVILAAIGTLMWTAGIGLIIAEFFETLDVMEEKLRISLVIFIVLGILGFIFLIPSVITLSKDIVTEYINPTSIIRTNDMTHVIYIKDQRLYTESYNEVKYWNATNIRIKVYSGNNIWNSKVNDVVIIGIW